MPGTDLIVRKEVDFGDENTLKEAAKLPSLLGLGFSKNPNKRSPLKVWAEKGANNCISRLNNCFPTVIMSRKVERNIQNRVKLTTSLVWSSCYDIGLVYCFVPRTKFNEIGVRIRKLIKAAGLDQVTPSDTVYKISTGLSPELMAIKQVVQLGLKMVDFEELGNSRFLIKMKSHDNQRPFWSTFAHQFNRLPLENR